MLSELLNVHMEDFLVKKNLIHGSKKYVNILTNSKVCVIN